MFLTNLWRKIFPDHRGGWFQEIDERNFGGQNIEGDIKRSDLTDFPFSTVKISELIDQKSTDFCVACGKAYAKEGMENKPMSWRGAYALYCKYIGGVPGYGASILKMLLACSKYGIPERSLLEYDPSKSRFWNADPNSLTQQVLENAQLYRDGSVWEAVRPYGWDRFDTFRAYLAKFRDQKIVIQTGIDSHNVTLIGQAFHPATGELCIYGPDSYGIQSRNYRIAPSINGYRYWNRTDANQLPAGNFAFDLPIDLAKLLNTYNNKAIKTADNADCYYVSNGQKHSLVNEFIAWSYGVLLFEPSNVSVLSQEEFDTIPTGDPCSFRAGSNWQLVRRLLEKFNQTDILNNIDK